jgi:hypothetical protein
MNDTHSINNIELTSAEISQLWSTYMSSSMTKCVISYFRKTVKEPEINSILVQVFDRVSKNLKIITDIFNTENHPIPQGFTDEDVNTNAKPLYSDTFIAEYIKLGSKFALLSYADALTVSSRSDVRKFFTDRVYSATDISNKIDDIQLKKGIYIRAPLIPVSQGVEFVQKQSFMNGFIGDKRPLNVLEISRLHSNIQTNKLGKALITGFAQVASSQKVKEYMVTGKNIAMKHIEMFSQLLKESDVPAPSIWDAEVMASTEAPFSEKLMMFHITALISFSLGAYGVAISNSMRSDLVLCYTKFMADLGKFSKDGADIMIENSWFEKAPEAVNRAELINV